MFYHSDRAPKQFYPNKMQATYSTGLDKSELLTGYIFMLVNPCCKVNGTFSMPADRLYI